MKDRRLILCLLMGIGLALAHNYVFRLAGFSIDTWWLDRIMNHRGLVKPPPDVVLIKVDDETFNRMHLRQRFFPRELYAAALMRLSSLGARGVAFDIEFSDDDPQPGADEALAGAMRSIPTILAVTSDEKEKKKDLDPNLRIKPGLREAAWKMAHIDSLNSSGKVRNFPPALHFAGKPIQSLALEAASLVNRSVVPVEQNRFINFYGPPDTMPSISLYELLNAEEESLRKNISGRVALIGYFRDLSSAAGAADKVITPLSERSMAGAELNATMIANILTGNAIRPFLVGEQRDWTLGFLIALGAPLLLLLPFWRGGAVTLTLTAGWIVTSYQALLHCYFLPGFLCFVVVLPALWLVRAIIGRLLLERKLSRLVHAFEFPIPRSVAKKLANNEALLEPAEKEMVVMYVDMEGSTAWARKTSIKEQVKAISIYYQAIGEAVTAQGGIMIAWRGDGALNIFGAPLPVANPEERALKALLDIRARLERHKKTGAFPPQTVRGGFHKGVVRLGLIGGGEHWKYTVLGDGANVGARVEGANKEFGTDILFSAEVAEALARSFPLLPLGSKEARGVEGGISFYTLVSKEVADEAGPGWQKAISLLAQGETAKAKEIFDAVNFKTPELEKVTQKLMTMHHEGKQEEVKK